MPIYKAKKDNIEFYIQPETIEVYSTLGYKIIRMDEVIVKNVKEEVKKINSESKEGSYEI